MRKANYPEELVPILLQAALTVTGLPFNTYFISPVSRRKETAWDAKVDLDFYPFYMQFKKPEESIGKTSTVRTERKNLGANSDIPFLFFYLQEKAKTKVFSQHDALYYLGKRHKAAYVCPLFMEQSLYQGSVQRTIGEALQAFLLGTNFQFWRSGTVVVRRSGASVSTFAPKEVTIFRDHVAIPAQSTLSNPENHRYSFTSLGEDICFHSPDRVEEAGYLSDWLQTVYEASRESSFSCKNRQKLLELIQELTENGEVAFKVPEEVTVQTWIEFGDFLEKSWGISQFAIIRRFDGP